jgi:uncharacterized protein YjcR
LRGIFKTAQHVIFKNRNSNSILFGGEVFAVSRPQSPERHLAKKIWLKSSRTKKPKQIADELGVSPSLVRKWKSIDKWEDTPLRRGAPEGNKNAVGNKGGPGGPPGNDHALKHGFFRKYLPKDEETLEIYDSSGEMDVLDLLYEEIRIAFTNFIRAQKIMFVKDQDDVTKVLKKEKAQKELEKDKDGNIVVHDTYVEREWEYQFAWDKQAKLLTSQAAAMRMLTSKIKQYEDMVRSMPLEQVKEVHLLRVEKLKADINAATTKAW